jgi:nucleoside-diphosphate-sugar epimerase
MFINDWVRQIIGGRQIVAPGTPKDWRPFVHVQDASKIILTSLVDSENVPDTIINVGNKDMNLQQQDIIKMVIDIGYSKGIEYNYEVIYRRDQDPTSLVENYKVDFFKYNDIYDFATTSMHNFDSGINDLFDKILGNTY